MRIQAPCSPAWQVYHAERCEVLKFVTMVDDEIPGWEEVVYPYVIVGEDVLRSFHAARKIEIIESLLLVVINPVEGVAGAEAETVNVIGEPA